MIDCSECVRRIGFVYRPVIALVRFDSTSNGLVCQQRFRVAISVASVLFAFLYFGALESRSDDSWEMKDLIAGWNRIDKRYQSVIATVESTGFSDSGESPILAKVQIKRRGNLFLYLYMKDSLLDLDPNDGVENPVLTERTRCNAVNNDYSFSLRRLGSENPWVISQYGPPGSDALASVQRQLQMATPGAALFGATAFCDGASMLVISARKDFRVQSIQMKELEGRKLALLEFTLTEKKLDNILDLRRGRVFCDPIMDFAVRRSEMEVTIRTTPNEVHRSARDLTYDENQNVQKVVVTTFNATHRKSTTATASIKDLEFAAPRESDFRLPAFGLPEIRPPSENSHLFIIIGIGILLLAFAMRLWLRRRSAFN